MWSPWALDPPEFHVKKARIATGEKPVAASEELDPMAILKSRRWPQTFSSLARHDFRWFTISQLAGTTANWMAVIVQSLIVYDLTGSALVIGVVNVSKTVPTLIFGFIGGMLADRMDRRNLLMASQLVSSCTAAALGMLALSGTIQVWHFVAAALLEGIAGSIQQPARQALLPSVVPREHLMNAIALTGGIWNASRTIGPAFAGGAAAIAGPSGALFLLASFYLFGAVATRGISTPVQPAAPGSDGSAVRAKSKGSRSLRAGFLEDLQGYSYLWQNPVVGWLAVLAIVPVVFSMGHRILAPVFAKEVLGMGAGGVGLLLSAPGVGALVAAFIVATMSHVQRKGFLSLAGVVLHGLSVIVYALSNRLWLSLTALAVHGFAMTAYRSLNQTLVQFHTEDEYRGRVMAVYAADRGLHPISGLMIALAADLWGVQAAVAVSGLGCVLLALVVGIKSPTIRHLD